MSRHPRHAVPSIFSVAGGAVGRITGAPSVDATTKLGYTVGGGLEVMVWNNWLLRGEFRYSDFGTITNTDVRTNPPFNNETFTTNYKLHLTTETALVGVAYKF
jgi:outer membrane immunogenic protein